MEEKVLKTEYQLEKEAREKAIYHEYNELIAQPGAMASAVDAYLMKKHGIHAKSTIWSMRKRAEALIQQEQQKS